MCPGTCPTSPPSATVGSMRGALLGSAILITLAACDDGGDTELHVALDGDDAWAGTAAKPVRTLARARDLVRERTDGLDADIVVQIHAGTHYLDEPLTLSAADS